MSPGAENGSPAMVRFAREIRWAIVDSGTRNASAISRVVSPPTARRVRATAEAGLNAGWQHRNISSSVSSAFSVGPCAGSRAVTSSRRRRAVSDRWASTSLRPATVTSQPFGSSG